MSEQWNRTEENTDERETRQGFGHGPCGRHGGHGRRPFGRRHAHPRMGRRGGPAGGRGFRRRFATREEQVSALEDYLGDLRAEAQAVEEHIAELNNR